MADTDQINREHVLQATAEYDRVGIDQFLETHGFAQTRDSVLRHDGRSYDAPAVLAVALQVATGTAGEPDGITADPEHVATVLRDLGFDVDAADEPNLPYPTATAVGQEHARATWALAARERLIETARTYHAVLTYKELSEFVQRRSLIKTNQLQQHWIGDVLGRVATTCAENGEPLLSSLCVDAHGRVSARYITAVEQHRGELVGDPDEHAAKERLECHRFFGAQLPPDGGVPARTSQLKSPRARTTTKAAPKVVPVEKPPVLCPVHFQVVPASGVCDLCD
jgi:hypothetical protein